MVDCCIVARGVLHITDLVSYKTGWPDYLYPRFIEYGYQYPRLLTWINFNPSMDN